jgi:hypothetical protein
VRKFEKIKQECTMPYEMKDLGELNFYLGMKATRTAEYVKLDQHRYCRRIALFVNQYKTNISYSMGLLARFSKSQMLRACKAVLILLIYLRGTFDKGICYKGDDLKVCAYSEAD